MFAKNLVFWSLASLASSLAVSISCVLASIKAFTSSDILEKAININSTEASSLEFLSELSANFFIFSRSLTISVLASPSN